MASDRRALLVAAALVAGAAIAVAAWLPLLDRNVSTAPAAVSTASEPPTPTIRPVDPPAERRRAPATAPTSRAEPAQPAADSAKAVFIARAEAVCAQATKAQRLLPFPRTAADIATYTRKTIAISNAMTSRLHSLQPPPADRKTIGAMLEEIDRGVAFLTQLALAAEQGDNEGVAAAGLEARKHLQRANAMALRYGLEACAAQGG